MVAPGTLDLVVFWHASSSVVKRQALRVVRSTVHRRGLRDVGCRSQASGASATLEQRGAATAMRHQMEHLIGLIIIIMVVVLLLATMKW